MHRYTVAAVDSAGNASADSPAVTATTPDALRRGHGIWLRSVATARGHGSARVDVVSPPARRGDVLVASVSALGTAHVTPPPGWHRVQRNVAGTALTMVTYYRVVSGRPQQQYSWGVGASPNAVVMLAVYAGAASRHPVAEASGQAGTTSAHGVILPAANVQEPGGAVIGFFGVAAKAALSTPAEMVGNVVEGDAANGKAVTAGSAQLLNASGPQRSMVAVSSRGGYGIGQIVVLRRP
jgi:hypothetical protein